MIRKLQILGQIIIIDFEQMIISTLVIILQSILIIVFAKRVAW